MEFIFGRVIEPQRHGDHREKNLLGTGPAVGGTNGLHGKAKTSGHRFCFAEHTDFADIKRENAEKSLKSSTGTLDEQK